MGVIMRDIPKVCVSNESNRAGQSSVSLTLKATGLRFKEPAAVCVRNHGNRRVACENTK